MSVKIEHRLGIAAPAEAVWEAIADIGAWPSWNPLYPSMTGTLRIGATLEFEAALPGQTPRALTAVITDWVPNEQILWQVRAVGGLIRTTRYLEIEALSPSGCIFSNGEVFGGVIGPLVARRMAGSIRAGFAAMGEAVSRRALATWSAAAPGA